MNRIDIFNQVDRGFSTDMAMYQPKTTWMSRSDGDISSLSYLRHLDQFVVKKVVSMTEVFLGVLGQSKYDVFNSNGEQLFSAFEESDGCQRCCCPRTRAFILHIVDSANQEIIRVQRGFRCCAGCHPVAPLCCKGCRQEVVVESPVGTIIGHVVQVCGCGRPNYVVKDANEDNILFIDGPGCWCDGPCARCREIKFTLYGTDHSTEIGIIHKKYRGFFAEALTSADDFSIQFPMNLDVRMKAVALGALFLIDFANYTVVN